MAGKNKSNKKTINPEAIVNENGANAADNKHTEKNFYPDVEYNKSKRIKFFSLYALLFLTMGVTIGAFISIGQWWIAIFSLAVIIFIGCFIPQTIKSYPVKKGVPQITVANREVKIGGQTFHIQDVENARVLIELAPVSKIPSENKAFVQDFASKMPEDECFGTVELSFKPNVNGIKKGEVRYAYVNDCLGALTAMVDAGLKHYAIGFSMKKIYEPAKFSITKTEIKQQKLTDVSQKDRLKQIM